MSEMLICCSCPEYGGDALACAKAIARGTTTPCACDCHDARPPEAERLREAMGKFVSQAMSVKKRNTPEWMAFFAAACNEALAALGTEDRVEWPGKWANEFHLISGG